MCLAIPMQIIELYGKDLAIVESNGAKVRVNIALLENPQIGEFVIIHAGYAIEKLDRNEADKQIELFRELAQLNYTPN